MKKIYIFIISLLALTNALLLAQGGSAYSRNGIGDLNFNFSTRRFALGNFATAGLDINDLNLYNPAALSSIRTVKILGSMRYDGIFTKDNLNTKSFSNYNLESAIFGVPVSKDNGIALVFSLSPYSRVAYNIRTIDDSDSTNIQKKSYLGNGGINSFSLGTSYRPSFGGAIGLSINYLIGTINYESKLEFSRTDYNNTSFINENRYRGLNFTIGLISPNLSPLLAYENINEIRLGLTFTNASSLSTEERELKGSYNADTVYERNFFTKLPYRLGLGLHVQLDKRYNLFLDYFQQNLADLERNNLKDSQYGNLKQFALGFELLPPSNPEKFIETLTYRLGFSYKQGLYNINATNVNEFAASLGLTIPFDQLNGFDIAFQYAVRGTLQNNMQKDVIYRLVAGINFSEIWFLRDEE